MDRALPSSAPIRHHPCMPTTSLDRSLTLARGLRGPVSALVGEVAATCVRGQRRLRPQDVTKKGVGDFVTAADIRCERRLHRGLAQLLPEAGFLGEESSPSDIERDLVWVVDPIDGTSNYARGLTHYAVSVALLWRRRPVLGVAHCMPEDARYVAVRGSGLRRDGRRMSPPRTRFDDGAMIGCQWFRGQADMSFLAALQGQGARIRTLGSTVVQLCDAAAGRLDANVQQQGRVWDFAAAGLIAEEAGLKFTDWTGRRVFPLPSLTVEHTPTVAARPAVHRRICQALRALA